MSFREQNRITLRWIFWLLRVNGLLALSMQVYALNHVLSSLLLHGSMLRRASFIGRGRKERIVAGYKRLQSSVTPRGMEEWVVTPLDNSLLCYPCAWSMACVDVGLQVAEVSIKIVYRTTKKENMITTHDTLTLRSGNIPPHLTPLCSSQHTACLISCSVAMPCIDSQ